MFLALRGDYWHTRIWEGNGGMPWTALCLNWASQDSPFRTETFLKTNLIDLIVSLSD